MRDMGLLEAALARPLNAENYAEGSVDTPTLAALYALAIVRSHPFIDGNKRVGLVLLETFLELNDYEFQASDADCVRTIFSLAAGNLGDSDFTAWVQKHSKSLPKR